MREDAGELVDRHADLIVRVAYGYLRSRDDALDVCQDVLLKLMLREDPFESAEHERAWVIRVTSNACKDLLASAARARTVPLDEGRVEAVPDEAEGGLPQTGAHAEVLEAVNALPESQRVAVLLHYYEDYPIAEVASLMGKSYDATAKDLSRARQKLRGMLEG